MVLWENIEEAFVSKEESRYIQEIVFKGFNWIQSSKYFKEHINEIPNQVEWTWVVEFLVSSDLEQGVPNWENVMGSHCPIRPVYKSITSRPWPVSSLRANGHSYIRLSFFFRVFISKYHKVSCVLLLAFSSMLASFCVPGHIGASHQSLLSSSSGIFPACMSIPNFPFLQRYSCMD